MKKVIFVSLALALAPVMALAQYSTTQDKPKAEKMSTKAISISGKVSEDGKTFVSDKDGKSWEVDNPEALKGHEGHQVIVSAHVDAEKSVIHVMSVKMAKASDATKKDEMKK
jgi:membrane protein implicated in regulation of membrane protease activity